MMEYSEIVAFHGHRCPGLAIGYRMSLSAMDALSEMRSEDEQLVAIVENDACGVDALQCVTGCTFGKGNLLFRDYGKQVYTLYSRSSRKGVRVLFHGHGVPEDVRGDRESFAKWVLAAPAEDMLLVTQVRVDEPEPARIHESGACAVCGERVMETRLQEIDGRPVCIPCARGHRAAGQDVPQTGSEETGKGRQ